MRGLILDIQQHPRVVSVFGSITGWLSFDALRSAQIIAAVLAALMTLCSLVLVAPKAITEVKRWFR